MPKLAFLSRICGDDRLTVFDTFVNLLSIFFRRIVEGVSTLPRFLHRGAAGKMESLTGGDTGMIRGGDRWLLILVRSNFKNFSKVVSKRPDFGH